MKKTVMLDDKLRQMLELLSEGASTQGLARKMGYSEGTVRVYLHNLYRAIGVRNRTEAVLWHMRSTHEAKAANPLPVQLDVAAGPAIAPSFGAAAESDGLLHALGVMESFLGPYGRMWEVALKLKGGEIDALAAQRQAKARGLWRALLRADFAYGKRLVEAGADADLLRQSPESVLLVLLLQAGGFTHAGDQALSRVGKRQDGSISARELELLHALRTALYQQDDSAMVVIHRLAVGHSTPPVMKHLAIVALYYGYLARKDGQRARATADALWAEAERARGQLAEMGARPFDEEAAAPAPDKSDSRRGTRKKAAAVR